ncbi:secreted Xaa-Pro aminopeptidase [Fimbriimonas ginsengisoli Gsoil 348]|uniref:Xaa-Pro aminopeptidase n=1 Tax=Fimbriimonas ginsengisoli Gsoil 348 TaxID=661478 RepID=A0A068NNC2_FIMGI|nr:secreted Xaa-Pro aminopeptidase [Fimbriimonas ginsengisoli Gsoil 348]
MAALIGFLIPLLAQAQQAPTYPVFENDKLPISLYKQRREAIESQLGASGAAILFTNPERNRTNDTDFRFRADSNFLYLTGFEEPDAVLVLAPGGIDIDGRRVREVLLVNESNPTSETWLGYRMGSQGVMSLLGVELALPNRRLGDVLEALGKTPGLKLARPLVPPDPSGLVATMSNSVNEWRKGLASNDLNVNSALAKMRVIKSPEEIVLLRKAAEASVMGHLEAMRSVQPGMREYEIQALVEYVFARNGCESVAYNSIVGSGPNSTILHYEADRRLMEKGDIVCMDVAGEYHGYAADVTRSFPVSGKFSPEQKAIYEIVLAAQDAGIAACKAGAPFSSAHVAAAKILGDGLLKLGVITDRNQLGRYFMHGTSHYVGLDVHDAHGDNTLREGAELTVEPGIYIKAGSPCDKKWWNIGVRIEDDILVTANGPVNLSAGAPRKVRDIEALMRQRGIGNIRLRK